jgi:hypothetical protein
MIENHIRMVDPGIAAAGWFANGTMPLAARTAVADRAPHESRTWRERGACFVSAHAAEPRCRVMERQVLDGPVRWDCLAVDNARHRVFLPRGDHVDVVMQPRRPLWAVSAARPACWLVGTCCRHTSCAVPLGVVDGRLSRYQGSLIIARPITHANDASHPARTSEG